MYSVYDLFCMYYIHNSYKSDVKYISIDDYENTIIIYIVLNYHNSNNYYLIMSVNSLHNMVS